MFIRNQLLSLKHSDFINGAKTESAKNQRCTNFKCNPDLMIVDLKLFILRLFGARSRAPVFHRRHWTKDLL